jgi:Predicted chitinase
MVLTVDQLKRAVPNLTSENAGRYIVAINETLQRYNIDTPLRVSHWLAEIGHECASFSVMSENLNYSAEGLVKVFPKYFKSLQEARQFARQPQKIANKVYANRLGNGNEASGDGWKYRGRSDIQCTGKSNYIVYSNSTGIDFVSNPDLLATAPYCIDYGGFYFSVMGILPLCDKGDSKAIRRKINGGYNGYNDTVQRLLIARKALGI